MTKPPHFSACKLLLAMLLLPALPATAALRCDHPLGRIAVLQGEVSITGSGAPVQAVLDTDICPGDTLDVADRSRVVLRMADGTTLPLDESSAIRLRGLDADGHTLVLELRHGRMNVQAGDAKVRLITQHGRADTEGGGFSVIVMEDQAQLAVARGAVALENATGKLTVRGDEAVFFDAVAAPRPNLLLKPGDAVQWVVRYPAIVDAATAGKNPQLAHAAAAYAEGRLVDAEIELDRIDASQRTAEYHVFRANLDLLNGRVADARLAADAALALQPQGASSCAMRAMVALAANETDVAEQYARRAMAADGPSAQAKLASSYLRQALGDKAAALELAHGAVALEPGNARAHNRVAELELILGHVRAARAASDRAYELAPLAPDTLTMRGFVLLASGAPAAAEQEFQAAMQADSNDARAHLGRGIAYVYLQQLERGVDEMEVAAALDPESSLVQSYLGRAYAAQGRPERSAAAYARAQELDANDPTPHVFRAQQLAAANQPGDALDAALDAHGLAGKRAVYRGAALVDEDRALALANATTQALVLGFNDKARDLAMQARQEAPSSWAAYRAAADSLYSLPRAQRARRSEDFQAALIEPLNAPFHLLEATPDTRAVSGAAPGQHGLLQTMEPGATGYNDFGAAFVQEGAIARGEVLTAGVNTFGRLLQARLMGRAWSFEIGHSGLKSDGFTPNQPLDNRVLEFKLRFALPSDTRIMLESRRFDSNRQEPLIPNDVFNLGAWRQSLDERREVQRVGLYQKIGENAEIMLAQTHDRDVMGTHACLTPELLQLLEPGSNCLAFGAFPGTYHEVVNSWGPEWRASWGNQRVRITVGSGRMEYSFSGQSAFGGAYFSGLAYRYRYLYSNWRISERLALDVGASSENYPSQSENLRHYHPKLGLFWQPFEHTRLRLSRVGSAFRPLAGGATLEPADVQGFNQLFPLMTLGTTRKDGLRWDQDVTRDLSAGMEVSRMLLSLDYGDKLYDRWHEKAVRAWAYQKLAGTTAVLPGWQAGVGFEADRQHYDNTPAGPAGYLGQESVWEMVQSFARVFLRARHGSGLGVDFSVYRVANHGNLGVLNQSQTDIVKQPFSGSAWMADVAVSWRLPGKLGQLEMGGKNIFDRRGLRYIDMDPISPRVAPERLFFARIQLSY